MYQNLKLALPLYLYLYHIIYILNFTVLPIFLLFSMRAGGGK